jgi:uncharacterized oligopeptide transporter (OPT) family protein
LFSNRFLLVSLLLCAVATAATPFAVLKLGMGVDMSTAGMFIIAAMFAKITRDRKDLAIQLNLVQTMIGVVQGMGFMVVILAAFYLLPTMTGRPELALNLSWWQTALWIYFSAGLGVFMGVLPRRMVLDDPSLPWPTGVATVSVAETLTDPAATEATAQRRKVLVVGTGVGGLVAFLRDGIGIIPSLVGNSLLGIVLSLDFIGIGFGMLLPLSVGLSGLIGVWLISAFGDHVAMYAALNGAAPGNWSACVSAVGHGDTGDFVTKSCGHAADYIAATKNGGSHFKFLVQWMMWPATSMMLTAAITGALLPMVKSAFSKKGRVVAVASLADEHVPLWAVGGMIALNTAGLVVIQDLWLQIPWYDVLLSVAVQPILIIGGLRIMAITGTGPVSLFGNAMQFLYGLARPGMLKVNLAMAQVAADAQASSESTAGSFWVARRLGGRFKDLLIAQVIVLPIGAVLTPIFFKVMVDTYGIGFGPGQLTAPTALKIASLALVMEKGSSGLPHGALTAALVAAVIGIGLEVLLCLRRKDASGVEVPRFPWLPVPSAVGFAMILPPSLTVAMAFGSVVSAIWRVFSTKQDGSYAMFAAPLASGFLAGESIVGGVLLPLLQVVTSYVLTKM